MKLLKFIKFVLALLLLPFLWASLLVLYRIAVLCAHQEIPWTSVILFASGFLLWLVLYFTFPRPNFLYVFQHEATHAIAVWMSGGKVSRFHVNQSGGHIIADRSSAWISLSPYIIPLYPLLTGAFWGILLWVYPDAQNATPWFLFFWGTLWSFHLSFTLSLIKTEQSDFSSQGYLFSWTLIALSNLWLIIFLIWSWITPIGFRELLSLSYSLSADTYRILGSISGSFLRSLYSLLR